MTTDCTKKKGRVRDLCECKGHDGRPDPRPADCEIWRSRLSGYMVSPLPGSVQPIGTRHLGGVGSELKKLLTWFGQYQDAGCACQKHADEMDRNGIEWCERNIDTIVGWLAEEAAKRKVAGWSLDKVPGFEWTARQLVAKAIHNAREKADAAADHGDTGGGKGISESGPYTRHLIGHIWPRRGNWQWTVAELLQRIEIFNGSRSIGIVTDESTDTVAAVKEAFASVRIDRWIELPNNPKQREGVTFFPLMDGLPQGRADLTWYWHGKSAQYGGGITQHWADAQHRIMLDGWRDVEKALTRYPIVGAFKRREGWQLPGAARWHYTGTAFAFRNADVFARSWRKLSKHFFCVEFWPPSVFKDHEAGCMFGDDATDLYKPENWKKWDKMLAERYGLKSVEELEIEVKDG